MTRAEAIDILKNTIVRFGRTNGKVAYAKALEKAIKALEEPQWIPCSERLPNTNGIYIVTRSISDGFEYQNITDACYFDGSNTWHDDTRINHERKYLADVLAWMPLPEPWRGDAE
jgi:hypothetical protein